MTPQEARPLKILMVLNRVPFPQNDGGAIALFSSITGYAENNCELHLLCMNTTKHFVDEETAVNLFSKYGCFTLVKIDNRPKVVDAFFNLFSKQSYILQRFSSPDFREKLIEILKEKEFDFVHLDTLSCTLYIDTIRKYSKAKVVYRSHNVEYQIWERSALNEANFLKRWYLKVQAKRLEKFEKEVLKKTDLVLAISRDDEMVFSKLTNSKVLLLPAGMLVSPSLPIATSARDIFFIGSFDWLPNIQGMEWFFETIWEDLKIRFPNLTFFIAGKKMPESILKLQDERITPLGEVEDAKQFMLSHGVMIVPLVSGSGIRIKIVEAMALGKAIIATTIAAEGLGITNGENILIADSSEEFRVQLEKCLDIDFVNKVGRKAHSFALEHFQNKRIFEELTNYYLQNA